MKRLLNQLYITTQGSYLHKERETLVIDIDGKKASQFPMHAIDSVTCFGRVMTSPALMGACAERGISLTFLTEHGRFVARVIGPQSGNVLLRRAQYRLTDANPIALARLFVASKIQNSRAVYQRHVRNHGQDDSITRAIADLKRIVVKTQTTESSDHLLGLEGDAARIYFASFTSLVASSMREHFAFTQRSRRPPTDRMNALLSFAYSLLTHEISGALQTNGLDPYVGFLHRDRPGRLSLALDVLEEFRSWWCDHFVLALVNRKQIQSDDFAFEATGAVRLTDDGRKRFLTAWQKRKQDEIKHPYLNETVPIGLLPHCQAFLMARHLRGELQHYPPFVGK